MNLNEMPATVAAHYAAQFKEETNAIDFRRAWLADMESGKTLYTPTRYAKVLADIEAIQNTLPFSY